MLIREVVIDVQLVEGGPPGEALVKYGVVAGYVRESGLLDL